MAFLLNSQAQGVSGKNEQSTHTPWRGAPEARGPMQLHRLHRLKAGPGYGNTGCHVSRGHSKKMGVALHPRFPDLLSIFKLTWVGLREAWQRKD